MLRFFIKIFSYSYLENAEHDIKYAFKLESISLALINLDYRTQSITHTNDLITKNPIDYQNTNLNIEDRKVCIYFINFYWKKF